MSDLIELKNKILSSRIIGENEVKEIKVAIYEDKKIDLNEAVFLFDLNDKFSGIENHSSWSELFIEAICSFLFNDENSPGVVDENEAKWLLKRIESDGKLDPLEKELLITIKKRSKSIPKNLEEYINKNS